MSKMRIDSPSDVAETLIIPLYFRAIESQRPDALIKDAKAVELIGRIDYAFSNFESLSGEQVTVCIRIRTIDQCVRTFLSQHPRGIVVDIGCGLDTRFHRVDNGSVEWYDLDLPEVIAVRKKLLDETPRCHFIASSAFDLSWMDRVSHRAGQAHLFVAEGLFTYFKEMDIKRLVLALRERFPGAELVFDAMSPFLVKVHNLQLSFSKVKARIHWGLKHSRELETWGAGIHLLNEWGYFDQPNPRLGWLQLLRFFPPINKSAAIVHFRLGM